MVNHNVCHVLIFEVGRYGENNVNQGVLRLSLASDSPGGSIKHGLLGPAPEFQKGA